MTIDKDMDEAAGTSNLPSGASSLAPLALEQEDSSLDLELQAVASEIESLAVEIEDVKVEDPDDPFRRLVFPPVNPKVEGIVRTREKREEKEEAPPQKTCKDMMMDCLPVCPPPVCGVLKEQLITFSIMVIIGLVFFLIYWFVE